MKAPSVSNGDLKNTGEWNSRYESPVQKYASTQGWSKSFFVSMDSIKQI